jgi:hypothetical protein
VRLVITGAGIASAILAAGVLGLWVRQRRRRGHGTVSVPALLGCLIGGALVTPVGLFLSLVVGGHLGVALGEAITDSAGGATVGLAAGIVVVAAGVIILGGLAGFALGQAAFRLWTGRARS